MSGVANVDKQHVSQAQYSAILKRLNIKKQPTLVDTDGDGKLDRGEILSNLKIQEYMTAKHIDADTLFNETDTATISANPSQAPNGGPTASPNGPANTDPKAPATGTIWAPTPRPKGRYLEDLKTNIDDMREPNSIYWTKFAGRLFKRFPGLEEKGISANVFSGKTMGIREAVLNSIVLVDGTRRDIVNDKTITNADGGTTYINLHTLYLQFKSMGLMCDESDFVRLLGGTMDNPIVSLNTFNKNIGYLTNFIGEGRKDLKDYTTIGKWSRPVMRMAGDVKHAGAEDPLYLNPSYYDEGDGGAMQALGFTDETDALNFAYDMEENDPDIYGMAQSAAQLDARQAELEGKGTPTLEDERLLYWLYVYSQDKMNADAAGQLHVSVNWLESREFSSMKGPFMYLPEGDKGPIHNGYNRTLKQYMESGGSTLDLKEAGLWYEMKHSRQSFTMINPKKEEPKAKEEPKPAQDPKTEQPPTPKPI